MRSLSMRTTRKVLIMMKSNKLKTRKLTARDVGTGVSLFDRLKGGAYAVVTPEDDNLGYFVGDRAKKDAEAFIESYYSNELDDVGFS
jgi:hypothetical protein